VPGDPRFEGIDAFVFDLDGVITDTARVHASAWKDLFDSYLAARAEKTGADWSPFDIDGDYRAYVDGKPRYDGVASFLASRGISLPRGDPSDEPGTETVCGLGNEKNIAFNRRLEEVGVDVYETTVAFVRRLRSRGVHTTVASSSKNCRAILRTAGIDGLFDAVVDGTDLEARGLPGKPDPAMFVESAAAVDTSPARAAVVEDAISGVEAGRNGGFRLVVGVDRTGHPQDLREAGADVVVPDLADLDRCPVADLPSALDPGVRDGLAEQIAGAHLAVFLDYDGTLTPIVAHPDLAILAEETRSSLRRLAAVVPVAIISGRDVDDVHQKVGVAGIYYAGSHGLDVIEPDGTRRDHEPARLYVGALDAAEAELDEAVDAIAGAHVERKRFAIAVHWRQVAEADVRAVETAVDAVHARHPELRKTHGKKVFELRPDVDWDKGKALVALAETLAGDAGIPAGELVPVYIGDDLTDEDAFTAIEGRGIGVVVAGGDHTSAADFNLADTSEVRIFLEELATLAQGGQ
jgi:alpha,alpha-trehalase